MASTVYTTDSIETPTPVQQEFTNHYDMEHPIAAIHDYARNMHLHTKRMMENAALAARRRTSSNSAISSLQTDSSRGSVNSVDQRE